MNAFTQNNETDSDEMSRNTDEADLPETEFLAREVADAKAALLDAVAGLKSGAAESLDLRVWARQYPWAALGVAAVAGFAAATLLAKKPTEEVCRENSPESVSSAAPPPPPLPAGVYPASASSGMKAMIIGALFGLAKIVIENLLIAALRGPTSPPSKSDNKPR